MAFYSVEVADHVEPEQALTKLRRFAQQLGQGEALLVPLPAGFPPEAVPGLAFHVRHIMEQIIKGDVPGEVPEQTEPVAM